MIGRLSALLSITGGLLFVFLSGACRADAQLEQLLNSGDYPAAWARAQQLEAEQAGDPEFDFQYGRAALQAGQPDYAVFALERVLLVQPDHHRARLELARAYFEAGNLDAAERQFQQVMAIDPPANVRANIQRFLDAIQNRRELLSQRWSAFVELRSGYDSNVGSATADSTVTIPAIGVFSLSDASQEQSDHFLDKNAGLTWQMPLAKTRGLFATVQYKDRENFATQASDLRSIGISAGPMFALAGGRLTIPVTTQYLYLANDRYRNLLTLGADWTRPLSMQDEVTLFGQMGKVNYPGQATRNVELGLIGVGWSRNFGEPDLELSVSGYAGDEDAESNQGEHNGKRYYGVRTTLDWPVRSNQSLYASLTGQWSEYAAQDPVFAVTREEEYANITLGWQYDILAPWRLLAEVSAIRNDSSIGLYEYDRQQVMVGVNYRFE